MKIEALFKGLFTTFRHLFRKTETYQYPEVKRPINVRFRGKIVQQFLDDGKEKCVACGLCAKVCPAEAIYLEAEERDEGERYPAVYTINEIRCIFCGFCVEGCPVEALALSKDYELAAYSREELIYDKGKLLQG